MKARYHLTGAILKSGAQKRGFDTSKIDESLDKEQKKAIKRSNDALQNDAHYSYLHRVIHADGSNDYFEYDNNIVKPVRQTDFSTNNRLHYRIRAFIYTREDCIKFSDEKTQLVTHAKSDYDIMMNELNNKAGIMDLKERIDTKENAMIFSNFCVLCTSDTELSSGRSKITP
jgi:hypothetical protein